ncbi:hypothetical protein P3W45_000305 [Vairimorpha bombi]
MSITKFSESPADTVTDILIHDNIVYVSSWDCCLYAYDLYTQKLLYKKEVDYPVLKIAWKNGLFFSDSKGFIHFDDDKKINFNIDGMLVMEAYQDHFIIGGLSGKVCKFYDNGHTDVIDVSGKVYGSSIENNNLLLNFGKKVGLYDLRNFNLIKYLHNKNSFRSVYTKKGKIYLGDIHGKLKIHDISTSEEVTVNAHIELKENFKRVYPVNDIIYENYLYTCGSDGIVNRWKEEDKLKSRCIFKSNLGVLKMAAKNDKLVVASGYNYEIGVADTSENSIYTIIL